MFDGCRAVSITRRSTDGRTSCGAAANPAARPSRRTNVRKNARTDGTAAANPTTAPRSSATNATASRSCVIARYSRRRNASPSVGRKAVGMDSRCSLAMDVASLGRARRTCAGSGSSSDRRPLAPRSALVAPTTVAATRRSSKRSSALARAASPICRRSAASSRTRTIASASRAGSRTGTRNPSTPSRATSRHPRTSVSTSGKPLAAASIGGPRHPLTPRGKYEHIHRCHQVGDVLPPPGEDDGVAAPLDLIGRHRIRFVRIAVPDHQEPCVGHARTHLARRREELLVALLADHPSRPSRRPARPLPHRAALGVRARAALRPRAGREPGEVDPVPQVERSAGPHHARDDAPTPGPRPTGTARGRCIARRSIRRRAPARAAATDRRASRTGRARCSRRAARRPCALRRAPSRRASGCGCAPGRSARGERSRATRGTRGRLRAGSTRASHDATGCVGCPRPRCPRPTDPAR